MDYPAAVARLLQHAGADLGDEVEVTSADGRAWRGLVMEHHAFSAHDILTLKLGSGYNIGVVVTEATRVTLARKVPPRTRAPRTPAPATGKPRVSILATGGTIASYVDYRTGAVTPVTTPEELAAAVPEILHTADLKTRIVFSMFSEDLQPEHWQKLAREVKAEFDGGARGVVVTHGTDTLQFTAAALSFFLHDLPGPVVLVGAQRSSDRPSSDASTNLHGAVAVAAQTDLGEVVVVMHAGTGDGVDHIHRGTRVRKMHTSRRDAFQSINARPLGSVEVPPGGGAPRVTLTEPHRPKSAGPVRVDDALNERVAMIQSYPGLWPEHIDSVVLDGVVLVGTGLGHVAARTFPALEKLHKAGKFVFMATQCVNGRVNMNVYSTGRDLQRLGVVPCEDMLPEVAYVKAMWALAHGKDRDDIIRLFTTPLAGEIDARTPVDAFGDSTRGKPKNLVVARRMRYTPSFAVSLSTYDRQFIESKAKAQRVEVAAFQEKVIVRAVELFHNLGIGKTTRSRAEEMLSNETLAHFVELISRPSFTETVAPSVIEGLMTISQGKGDMKKAELALHVLLPYIERLLEGPIKDSLRVLGYAMLLEAGGLARWEEYFAATSTYADAIDLFQQASAEDDPLSILAQGLEDSDAIIKASQIVDAIRQNAYRVVGTDVAKAKIVFGTKNGEVALSGIEIGRLFSMTQDLALLLNIGVHLGAIRIVGRGP